MAIQLSNNQFTSDYLFSNGHATTKLFINGKWSHTVKQEGAAEEQIVKFISCPGTIVPPTKPVFMNAKVNP